MLNKTFKISMLVAGGMLAMTAAARADVDSHEFCKAIGIGEAGRAQCAADMDAATTPDTRDAVAARWVSHSPLASKDPNSLYQPPVDNNEKNGTPGTPYQDKVKGVSNETAAQIHRAMKIDHLE